MNPHLKTNSIALTLLAMNQAEALPAFKGDLADGGIFAMNEGEFASAHYDQQLTNYLVGGWDQDDVMGLLDFFCPVIRTSRSVDYKEYNIADEFLADDGDEDIRGMNADFATAQGEDRTNTNRKIPNKGFKVVVDRDRLLADPGYARRLIRKTLKRLLRNDLRRAIALLDAAAVSVNRIWDNAADPDQNISDLLLLSEETSGLRPSRVAYGSKAWSLRQSSIRSQDNAGVNASAKWSPEELAAFLMVEALSWGEVRYRASAAALANYVGSNVYMFNAAEGLSEEDPSNIKRFVTAADGGLDYAVHVDETHPKLNVYYVEHYSLPALTSPLGIRKAVITDE